MIKVADIEELKALVNQQIRDGIEARKRSEKAEEEAKLRSKEVDRRNEASQKRIEDLDEMGRLWAAAAAVPAVADAPANGPVLEDAV